MKILFVDPLIEDERFFPRLVERFTRSHQQALSFPILAARSPKQHSIEFIQGNAQKIDFEKNYDLVGISSITSNAPLAYEIADEFQNREIPVVLGGWHPSALPAEAKQHADSVVVGEAEEIWPQLLQDAENQKLKPLYTQEHPVDPKNIPSPRTDLYGKRKNVIVLATRGCINRCEFCAIANMTHRRHFRTRAVEAIIKEIEMLPGRSFIFYDDCLTIDASFTKRLFKEMKNLNKKFVAMGTTNRLAQDEELLRLAYEAGCISWAIGFESLSQTTLDSIGKRTNTVSQYPLAIEKIHDYGMWVQGWFVFGFEQDTLDTFEHTTEFVRRNEIDLPEPLILTPFPGTPLYDRLEQRGRLLTKDWRMYDTKHVVFQPLQLSPEELYTKTLELHKKWYSITSIIERTLSSAKFGLATFLSAPSRNFFKRTHGPQT